MNIDGMMLFSLFDPKCCFQQRHAFQQRYIILVGVLFQQRILINIDIQITHQMKPTKNFKGIDQTLGLLSFIAHDEKAFNDQPYTYKQQQPSIRKHYQQRSFSDFSHKKQVNIKPDNQDKKSSEQPQNGENSKKNINKNRAIKRIIQTSKQILEKNYKYTEPVIINQTKSYITQYNIFLKQYTRLNEKIRQKEIEKQNFERRLIQEQENYLKNINNFTVNQDYRQLILVAILKQVINRDNMEIMLELFREMLVCIKKNELKLYYGNNEECQSRTFRLFEIGNVDYHSQPHFFTILTISDKSKGYEYIHFKLNSLHNQNKLDWALYCNYMTRKISTKQKYFEIEYPPEKQGQKNDTEAKIREIKQANPNPKRDKTIKQYDIDRQRIIRHINEGEREASQLGTYGSEHNQTLLTSRKDKLEKSNTDNPALYSFKFLTPRQAGDTSQQSLNKNQIDASKRPTQETSDKKPSKRRMSFSKLFDSMAASKNNQPTKQKNNQYLGDPLGQKQQRSQKANNLENEIIPETESHFEPSKNLDPGSQNISKNKNQNDPSRSSLSFVNHPEVHRKIKIKQKYQDGLSLTKSKFFKDKDKIFYLTNQGFEYWDYDQKTKHKSEKKMILLSEIKKYGITDQSIHFQLNNKQLTFNAQERQCLQDMVEWLQLNQKEKQQSSKVQSNN